MQDEEELAAGSLGTPPRSLASIAESAGLTETIAKIEDPEAWEACSGCGRQYLRGRVLPGRVCVDCQERSERDSNTRKRQVLACGGERAFRLFTREAFKVSTENKAAVEAVDRFNCAADNLLFWGSCGTGKSHLAAIIGREHATYDGRVIFTEPAPLLRSLRLLKPHEEQEAINRYVNAPVLIIDDLGIEKDTEFAVSTISEIVSHRLKADRNGLVVTSNLSLEALAAKLGDDRLTSRLAGMCQVIEIRGTDHRLRGEA